MGQPDSSFDVAHRQVVVFVRVNNMDTLETEVQRTYVVEADGLYGDFDDVILDALDRAHRQAEKEAK